MTETEKQLILKVTGDLAEEHYKTLGKDVNEFFPLQDPRWDVNRAAKRQKLLEYQEWIAKEIEKAIPKSINWSAIYAVKQGPSESPSEFLDRLKDTMRRSTPLDPKSDIGIQQLVSSFLG